MSKIIGIDLGTTFSAIAQLDDLGNPEVLASTDTNKKITASIVYLKDKNVIVGDKAIDALAATPKNVVTETKRQMENDVVFSPQKGDWIDKEGAEEGAQLVMAAKDMVDRVTGWMEDTAEMQTESMLELGDSIRDELGSEMSEQFIQTVKPALENLYTVFEQTREALTSGVAIITGEGGPEVMPGGEEVPTDDTGMEPIDAEPDIEGEPGAEEPVADEFGASEPATGGEEVADREKRESVQRSRRLGSILSSEATSKKKS